MAGWLRARLSRRPVRDLFLTLLVIAVVSVLFTCHVTRFVTAWLGTSDIAPGWNIRFKGHVEIYRRVGATRADANALEGTTMRGDGRRRAWTRGRGQIPRELSRRLKEVSGAQSVHAYQRGILSCFLSIYKKKNSSFYCGFHRY